MRIFDRLTGGGGYSSATLDVVISRRLMPDRHISRPVPIITG